jgi:acetylornithine deacetylase/succinyl-diaminopimelate desuccinylase-like protein
MHEGQIYARGAQDNKGQCFYVLQALKYYKTVVGSLPINIKLIIEGEEECGSHGLLEILPQKAKELKADYLAIVDLGIPNIDTPAITLGIRGLVTMDVKVTGSNTDLHSGSHGGLVFNPLHALTSILGKLRDDSGKITIPGFYDSITPISKEEIERLSLTFDDAGYFKEFETVASGGETAYTPLERNWLRPTLEVNGLWGGYTGSGFKTVIPAQAFAKISCRLVPGQDPATIGKLVAKAIESHAPKGIKVEVDIHAGGGPAVRGTPDSRIVQAVAKAYEETFQKPCKYILEGASIPVVSQLAKTCSAETVLLGLGLPGDKIHAPNEHFGVDRLAKGFEIISRTIQHLRQ